MPLRLTHHVRLAVLLFLICPASLAAAAEPVVETKTARLTNPFFAFDNGTGRGTLSADAQARMVAELGYKGIGYTGGQGIPEMLGALDKSNLKMFSIYVAARVGKNGPSYDPRLKEALAALKGRETFIWLTVQGSIKDDDAQAVKIVGEVADLAAKAGLRVALYPHVGFYVARTEDALRIVKKAKRPNLGVSLNLCHFLKLDRQQNLAPLLKQALPHLMLVSINGADHEGGWDRLIQTLDRGQFDVYAFLKQLKSLGYDGPIGLQCYAIKGDRRENLQRSISAWRGFVKRMAKEGP